MFRATMCSSSGESIVSIRHLVYVTLCRWPSGMHLWIHTCIPDGHPHRVTYTRCRIDTTDSPDDEHTVCIQTCIPDGHIYSDKRQIYWYNWFSWWWAHSCSKHVEYRNKHIRKELCVKLVICNNYTEMHRQQNIKLFMLPRTLRPFPSPIFFVQNSQMFKQHYVQTFVQQNRTINFESTDINPFPFTAQTKLRQFYEIHNWELRSSGLLLSEYR